jgi:hypothetical protein
MSIARKLAIPAAGLAAAAIAPGAGTAAAATVPHHSDAATVTQPTPRRARAVDILGERPVGVHPDTASASKSYQSLLYIHFYISGAKSYVGYASTYACNNDGEAIYNTHLEIRKPNGVAWKNGAQRTLSVATCASLYGHPDIHDAGEWTAILWEKLSGNNYANLISAGIHVLT